MTPSPADLIVWSHEPLNAEPPLEQLGTHFVTPTPLFYIRTHGTIPTPDPAAFRLTVEGMVREPLSLSLDDLRSRFAHRTQMATLQCAGNRRTELIEVEPIPGETPWDKAAIGNAVWGGVALRDVLAAAGVEDGAAHVAFMGLDGVERLGRPVGFGGSVPLRKAQQPEVLLAWEMNGEPLAPNHGGPLRVVAPGFIGARSVKWLSHITLQREPSDNYFQAHAYKLFPPNIRAATVDWDRGLMLGELSVNAVICAPAEGETVAGRVVARGYALAGGDRCIERVDVSADGGASWQEAELLEPKQPGVWQFWQAKLDLAPGEYTLAVRSWDSAANTQPEHPAPLWNFKGYMNNAWHRVQVTVAQL